MNKRTPEREANLLSEADGNEFARELGLMRELEAGTCELEIDSRHHTITITDKATGKPVFHTSIAEYEQLLETRKTFRNGHISELKPESLGGEH